MSDDTAILKFVSESIGKDVKSLGRELGLTDAQIENICIENREYPMQEVAYQMLATWKQMEGQKATHEALVQHLMNIGRADIALKTATMFLKEKESIYSTPGCDTFSIPKLQNQTTNEAETEDNNFGLLVELQRQLRKLYKNIQLKGLPWMDEVKFALRDHYVELTLIGQDERGVDQPEESIQLTEIFKLASRKGKKGSKILLEGAPGFGKTTLGYKLCYDYAVKCDYVQHFDLAILLPLRQFAGDLNEVMVRAAGATDEEADSVLSIINNQARKILLVLDGYDELPFEYRDYILTVIRGEVLPYATIVVTSRPGIFASVQDNRRNSWLISKDVDVLMNLFTRRIRITGVSTQFQLEFVRKHLSKIPEAEAEKIIEQFLETSHFLREMTNVLQCPLFLLMLVLILIDTEHVHFQNLKTQTDLYKQIMNFIIRRHLSKSAIESSETVDLFEFDIVEQPYYVTLLYQFGEFSLEALTSNIQSFSLNDILGPENKRDERILDLGLLTKTITVKAIWEKVYHEPVHKSLMEFSAAYYLWIEYRRGARDAKWDKTVCSFRPNYRSSVSSLVFLFLTGLMREDAVAVFGALKPYAAEYCHWLYAIEFSLSEIEVTDTVFDSLLPFIPVQWNIHDWWYDDLPFTSLSLCKKILSVGLQTGKIRQTRRDLEYVAHFPEDAAVETLILYVIFNVAPIRKCNPIRCTHLVCYFNTSYPSDTHWPEFLNLLKFIEFKNISFHFMASCSFFLPLLHNDLTNGFLQNAKLNWLQCNLVEMKSHLIQLLSELIQQEKVRGCRIVLWPSPTSYVASALCNDSCHDCNLLSKGELGSLVLIASESSYLVNFELRNDEEIQRTIDLAKLFNKGKKSWSRIRLYNIKVEHSEECWQNQMFRSKFLEIKDSGILHCPSYLLNVCQIESLSCNSPFLAQIVDPIFPCQHVVEVYVVLDASVFHKFFFARLKQLQGLRILSLEITSFDYHCLSLSVETWFLGTSTYSFDLRGLEIRTVEDNFELASDLLRVVIRGLNEPISDLISIQSQSSALEPPKKLRIEYLALLTYIYPDCQSPSTYDIQRIEEFISLVQTTKEPLTAKLLKRLDVLTWGRNFMNCMAVVKPLDFATLLDIFPPDECFRMEHDICGMKENDSIWNRQQIDFRPDSYNRFSISHINKYES